MPKHVQCARLGGEFDDFNKWAATTTGAAAQSAESDPPAGLRALKRTKTATAPVLIPGAYVRAPSIGRNGASRALREATRSAAGDTACIGSGSDAETLVRLRIGRPSVVAGSACARFLRQLAAVCCAEALLYINIEAARALGPMLTASAREQ